MNRARRKVIETSLASLKEAQKSLMAVLAAEKEYLGRIPDDDENEDKIDAVGELIEHLDDAASNLQEAIDTLDGGDF